MRRRGHGRRRGGGRFLNQPHHHVVPSQNRDVVLHEPGQAKHARGLGDGGSEAVAALPERTHLAQPHNHLRDDARENIRQRPRQQPKVLPTSTRSWTVCVQLWRDPGATLLDGFWRNKKLCCAVEHVVSSLKQLETAFQVAQSSMPRCSSQVSPSSWSLDQALSSGMVTSC